MVLFLASFHDMLCCWRPAFALSLETGLEKCVIPGDLVACAVFRARSRDALATCQNSAMSFRNGLRRQKRSFVHERARETRTDAQLNRRRFRRNHFHRDKYRRAHFAAAEIKQNAVSTRASIASVALLINERVPSLLELFI